MRIGIDARLYGPQNGGLGRYIQKLLENLEQIDRENDYVVFLFPDNFEQYQPQNPRFKKVLAPYRWYSLKEQILLPHKIKKEKVDLMHFPHFNVPIFYSGKFVVTIHDLIITHFPASRATTLNPLLYQIKLWGYKFIISQAIKKAKKILAVSQTTKKELVEHFNVPPEKIVVSYEGFCLPSVSEEGSKILSDFNINKPYLLYVGNAYPHKNLERLLRAFKKFLAIYKKDIQLVLAGREDFFYQRLKKYAFDLGLFERVLFTGYLEEKELTSIYKNALLYIFPSLMEGFGLPPLEAMSLGLAVLSSHASCLPEILSDAVMYFNPYSEEEITDMIYKVLEDKELQEKLKNKGKEYVKKFSWQECAKKTLEVYKFVL